MIFVIELPGIKIYKMKHGSLIGYIDSVILEIILGK